MMRPIVPMEMRSSLLTCRVVFFDNVGDEPQIVLDQLAAGGAIALGNEREKTRLLLGRQRPWERGRSGQKQQEKHAVDENRRAGHEHGNTPIWELYSAGNQIVTRTVCTTVWDCRRTEAVYMHKRQKSMRPV